GQKSYDPEIMGEALGEVQKEAQTLQAVKGRSATGTTIQGHITPEGKGVTFAGDEFDPADIKFQKKVASTAANDRQSFAALVSRTGDRIMGEYHSLLDPYKEVQVNVQGKTMG